MKTRSIISMLLILAMLLGLMAGCGTTAEESTASGEPVAESMPEEPAEEPVAEEAPEEETPEEPALEEPSAVEEPVEEVPAISYPLYEEPVSFTWLDIVNNDYNQGVVTEDLAENEVYKAVSEITGINVEWDLRMDAATVYALMIAGGDYPDCWGSKLTDYYSNFVTAYDEEVVMDITDLVQEYMPNYLTVLEDNGLVASAYAENGMILCVMPVQTGYTQFGGQIRGDIMEKLGLEMPETFDDMYEVLKAMKAEYPDSQPMILSKDGSQNCSWLGGGLGVMTTLGWRPFVQMNIYQIDGEVKLGLVEPEYKEYVEMIAKWYAEGLLYKDFYNNQGMGPPQDAISSNTSFVWYGSVNEIPTLTEILPDEDAYIVGMTDVTRTPGEIIHLGDNISKSLNGSGYAISTDCDNPEYVLQYFDYLYSPEGKLMANYGIEGDTYTVKDGDYYYTDKILNNDTYTYVSALFKYCIYEGPFELDVGRYFASFNEVQREAVELWEANRDQDWNMPVNMTYTTEESEARATIVSDLGTYCSEMLLKFMVGDISIDEEWDAFIDQVYALGAQDLIDLSQQALDRYYES